MATHILPGPIKLLRIPKMKYKNEGNPSICLDSGRGIFCSKSFTVLFSFHLFHQLIYLNLNFVITFLLCLVAILSSYEKSKERESPGKPHISIPNLYAKTKILVQIWKFHISISHNILDTKEKLSKSRG